MNWLFLRGLVREKLHWGDFPQLFESQVSEAKIHFLDLPGIGTQEKEPSPVTISGIVDDLRLRWVDLCRAHPGEWSCLAISLGAMAAMNWASRFPEDFKNLVLINSSSGKLNPPWQRLRYTVLPSIVKSARIKDPILRELNVLQTTVNLRKDLPEISKIWGRAALEKKELRNLALRQIAAAILFAHPKDLKPDTLILSSAKDRFTHPDCSKKLAEELLLEHRIHPLAGHDLPMDDGDWVIQQIREYFSNNGAATKSP